MKEVFVVIENDFISFSDVKGYPVKEFKSLRVKAYTNTKHKTIYRTLVGNDIVFEGSKQKARKILNEKLDSIVNEYSKKYKFIETKF